jgi:hypothetical protein
VLTIIGITGPEVIVGRGSVVFWSVDVIEFENNENPFHPKMSKEMLELIDLMIIQFL